MLTHDDFGERVEAHLLYALDLPTKLALAVYGQRLRDGSWVQTPTTWANKFGTLAWRSTQDGTERDAQNLLAEMVDTIIKTESVSGAIREVLVALFSIQHLSWEPGTAAAFAAWFVRLAQPGDAAIAADILERTRDHHPLLEEALLPVAVWLVDHGAAELRARRRLHLCLWLVPLFLRQSVQDLLLPAVRYVFENEQKVESLGLFEKERDTEFMRVFRDLLSAIHWLLDSGVAGPQLVADLTREYGGVAAAQLIAALAADERPKLREAAFTALTRTLVPLNIAEIAWARILAESTPPPDETIAFTTREASLAALRGLGAHMGEDGTAYEAAWTEIFVRELLRFSEELRPADLALVDRCVGYHRNRHPTIDDAVRKALLAHVTTRDHRNDRAERVLRADGAKSGSLSSALVLIQTGEAVTKKQTAPFLRRVKEGVESVVRTPVAHRYEELSVLLARCQEVVFHSELEGELKVRVGDGILHVDETAVAQLLKAGLNEDDAVAVGVLYVVHEVVHICQRIDDKADVARLRSTGAETTLMHVDLGADHVAAIATSAALPALGLSYLKDVVGRSMAAFPTEAHHTTAARSRKAHRLVGARLDFLAREVGVIARDADEYAFAEYGPAGGIMILMRSGPPWGLLGSSRLPRSEAELLYTAADLGKEGVRRLDAILRKALESIRSGG